MSSRAWRALCALSSYSSLAGQACLAPDHSMAVDHGTRRPAEHDLPGGLVELATNGGLVGQPILFETRFAVSRAKALSSGGFWHGAHAHLIDSLWSCCKAVSHVCGLVAIGQKSTITNPCARPHPQPSTLHAAKRTPGLGRCPATPIGRGRRSARGRGRRRGGRLRGHPRVPGDDSVALGIELQHRSLERKKALLILHGYVAFKPLGCGGHITHDMCSEPAIHHSVRWKCGSKHPETGRVGSESRRN